MISLITLTLMSLYTLLVFLFTGSVSFILSLILLEILSWVFILLSSFHNKSIVMKYMVMQSFFVFMSVLGCYYNLLLFLISLFIKISIPPFHGWLLKMMKDLSLNLLLFLVTIHKFMPMLMLASLISLELVILLMVLIVLIIPSTMKLEVVLLLSSFSHTLWASISFHVGTWLFFLYWSLYSLMVVNLLKSIKKFLYMNFVLSQNLYTSIFWLILAGLPPFMMFWLKVMILISQAYMMEIMLSIMILSMISIMYAYFRLILINFISTSSSKVFVSTSSLYLLFFM